MRSFGMEKSFHPTMYWTRNYLSILGLKLRYVINGAFDMFQGRLNIFGASACLQVGIRLQTVICVRITRDKSNMIPNYTILYYSADQLFLIPI